MFVSFIVAIPLSFFFLNKKNKKEVFFLGHKFDDNISRIINVLRQSQEYDYQYCTIVFKDYLFHKKSKLNCLYLLFSTYLDKAFEFKIGYCFAWYLFS